MKETVFRLKEKQRHNISFPTFVVARKY